MLKVLVVDDATFMRMMIKEILEKKMNCEVVGEAGNGTEAFEKYKELKPDLVTMDITMPKVDGLEGLKLIRKYDSNAKVIMCSAMGQQAMVVDAIENGALDFIVKPFQPDRVVEAINKVKAK